MTGPATPRQMTAAPDRGAWLLEADQGLKRRYL
jgi:hypothetical protein